MANQSTAIPRFFNTKEGAEKGADVVFGPAIVKDKDGKEIVRWSFTVSPTASTKPTKPSKLFVETSSFNIHKSDSGKVKVIVSWDTYDTEEDTSGDLIISRQASIEDIIKTLEKTNLNRVGDDLLRFKATAGLPLWDCDDSYKYKTTKGVLAGMRRCNSGIKKAIKALKEMK